MILFYSARYDAIFCVDTSIVFTSLASKAANHKGLIGVSALNTEWAWSGVLEVATNKFVEIIFWVFHFVSSGM
jgi:hypothetical protein